MAKIDHDYYEPVLRYHAYLICKVSIKVKLADLELTIPYYYKGGVSTAPMLEQKYKKAKESFDKKVEEFKSCVKDIIELIKKCRELNIAVGFKLLRLCSYGLNRTNTLFYFY